MPCCRDIRKSTVYLFCLLFLPVTLFCSSLFLPATDLFAEESVCAVVKIEIKQEMTFERQAFDAHMVITNGLTTISLENINVDVLFSDEQGETVRASSDPDDVDALFYIRIDSMEGIDDVGGSGTIAPVTSGDIHWLIIPAPGSVEENPTGALYFVGARLTYDLGGEEYVTRVTPDFITVRPLPLLSLDYFLPDEVYGDDPFTVEEEPSIPFSLGVRISNNGHGVASDVKIDSAQPKIIDNEQGLTIDFLIEGSEVNGITGPDTLLLQFGDIDPETSIIGRWLMSCPLSGRFTEFKAEYSHSNELGGELTSLLEDVKTHFLVQDVLVDAPGRDTLRDFLGRDSDQMNVYESDAGITSVSNLSDGAQISFISETGGIARYSVKVAPTAGFFYLQFADPQNGEKVISEVVRSDGKMISRENGWLSKKRVGENWSFYGNLFDFNSTGSYIYTLIDPALAPQPPAFSVQDDPVQKEGEEISFILSLVDDSESEPAAAGFKMLSISRMMVQSAGVSDSIKCDSKIAISAGRLPVGAKLIDRCDGTALLLWTPQEGQSGDYPLTFTATDGEFSTTIRYHLTVTDPANTPTALFSADTTSGRAPLTVLFIDESVSKDTISGWFWDFGDGSTSSEQIPSHTYDTAGLYSISLTVVERDGDQHSIRRNGYITVENEHKKIPIEYGHIVASSDWQSLGFTGLYKDPVVVATFTGGIYSAASFIRIRNISPGGFEIRAEGGQPVPGEDQGDISYIVVESGSYTLQDGSILYARHFQSSADGSELNPAFSISFSQIPVVVSTVTTDNESALVTPALANITTDGFQLRLQSEEKPGMVHGTERVDCIAWEPGSGLIEGTVFEVGYLEQVSESWDSYLFTEQFATAPSFVAARQDRAGSVSAGMSFQSLDPFGIEVRLSQNGADTDNREIFSGLAGFIAISSLSDAVDSDGDGIADLEERLVYGTHPGKIDSDLDGIGDYEERVYWGDRWDEDMDGDTRVNLLDRDADNDGFRDGLEILHGFDPADGSDFPTSPIMEIGRVAADGDWQSVQLQSLYLDPVVVATITESSGQAAYVRIRNIGAESFEIRTTTENEEGVSYIVMERHSYRLPGGTLVVAGSTEASPADKRVSVSFSDDFDSSPVVVASIVSAGNPGPVSVVLHKVAKESFVCSLQTDKFNRKSMVIERIDFIGWQPSAGVAGEFIFESGYFDHVRKTWQEYHFSSPLYGIQALVGVVQKNRKKQGQNIAFRHLEWSGIEIRKGDLSKKRFQRHRAHTNVGFIALSYIPQDLDSDGDGLTDRDEIQIYLTDPLLADSDGDGLSDGYEAARWGDSWGGDTDNDGLVNILDIDSDNDGYNDGLEFVHGFDPADSWDFPDRPIMSVGNLQVNSEWQSVFFDSTYIDPVVVVSPEAGTSSRGVIRVRNVVSTGFDIRCLNQGESDAEVTAVSYVVMERGEYILPDGEKVLAGHVTINARSRHVKHTFVTPFVTIPVIMASIREGGESDSVFVGAAKITPRKFRLGLYDFAGHTSLNDSVMVDYIAWESSIDLISIFYHE